MTTTLRKETVFERPFDLVVQVYLSRYPTTEDFPRLLDHQISRIKWDVDKGIFLCDKRSTMSVPVPKLLQKISKVDHIYIYQNLEINIPERTMKEDSWNRADAKMYRMNEDANWKGCDGENGNEFTKFVEESNVTVNDKVPSHVVKIVMKKVQKVFEEGYQTARNVDTVLFQKYENNMLPVMGSIQDFCLRQINHQNLDVTLDFTQSFEHNFELSHHEGKFI
ncbi:hypothetical protein EIN_391400 [Entamoeba invadens IP1]|uniref:PRELI/MSF1 domain-containing protein n=1 Tax=Entamoeba invadens IP1 TaxID=370355 RepID=A0A0A1U5A0_ENTIV|nr:hypothetical protein EIN_391400 [Entamoeba invadens IP1]ELP89485.1 hypothetical protein EIN_391400 [Entamoeba invadens IP1]|eukprot:XP_004256256.1 hypothetical protein EIN_391400 [Entamoeba invadens IP1]